MKFIEKSADYWDPPTKNPHQRPQITSWLPGPNQKRNALASQSSTAWGRRWFCLDDKAFAVQRWQHNQNLRVVNFERRTSLRRVVGQRSNLKTAKSLATVQSGRGHCKTIATEPASSHIKYFVQAPVLCFWMALLRSHRPGGLSKLYQIHAGRGTMFGVWWYWCGAVTTMLALSSFTLAILAVQVTFTRRASYSSIWQFRHHAII